MTRQLTSYGALTQPKTVEETIESVLGQMTETIRLGHTPSYGECIEVTPDAYVDLANRLLRLERLVEELGSE